MAYHNGDTVKLAVYDELKNLLSSHSKIRQSAGDRIKQLEITEGYGVYLSELILDQTVELPLRQIACSSLTRYVETFWNNFNEEGGITGESTASNEAKHTIRTLLPNGLYDPNSKIRSSVAHTIATISSTDWPDVWTELFDIIIKCLTGNEYSIHGAMKILQDFSYDEKLINELGPVIVSEVYNIFESEEKYTIRTRAMAISILKPLIISIRIEICDKMLQSTMINSILNMFMEKLIYYLSPNVAGTTNFMLRIEIVKLLTFLVSDMCKYLQQFMERILPVIWQLLTQIADTYGKITINQTEPNPFPEADSFDTDDELSNFITMIIHIFEFIQCVIGTGKFRTTLENVLTDLIYIIIIYIQVTQEQVDDWNEDPEEFVEDQDNGGVVVTIRSSGQDVLCSLYKDLKRKALPALQEALSRHMNMTEIEKSSGNPNWWKLPEACLLAVHIARDLITSIEDQFDLVNYLTVVRNWLNYHDSPHLVGRALWTLSTYSSSKLYNYQTLDEILNAILESLQDEKSVFLKISAVRSIYVITMAHEDSSKEKRMLIQSKLLGFTEGILSLVPLCKRSLLGILLDTLTVILMFDVSFVSTVHAKLIPTIVTIFLKYAGDLFTLQRVEDLIKSMCHNSQCVEPLQQEFVPVIINILTQREDRCNKQDVALDVLTTIIKYTKAPLSPTLIENAFPAMIHCVLNSDDHEVMVSGGECLRAFINISPEQVASYKNGDGLNYTMQLATMLLNPTNNEMTAYQVGRLIITIISKMGNILGDNVDMLLKAVISKMQLVECLKVIMSLVIIFAYLFLTQMEAVLNFLTTVPGPTGEPAIHFVFSHWLSKQPLFFGLYERKVTTMALCQLFEYGISTQDTRLTTVTIKELIVSQRANDTIRIKTRSQANDDFECVAIPALVKMFKLLINEMCHLKEDQLARYESESEEENDSGSSSHDSSMSDLSDIEDEKDSDDDDSLTKHPLFQINMKENLTKFLQNFAVSEHFPMFASHLTDAEKVVLKSIHVDVI